MATATTRKPRSIRPVHGIARLVLHINNIPYIVRPLAVDPGSGVNRLVRLRKAGNVVYHAHRDEDGRCSCDCPDFEFSRRGTANGPCKHVAALAGVGLL